MGVPTYGMYQGADPPPVASRFIQLVVWVVLNGKEVEALVDTGSGKTLVHHAEWLRLFEIMQLKGIHGDIREYSTV